MLDIIDAQLALSTAQLNFISAQYDYARYKATVENAMGLGIGETPENAAPGRTSAAASPAGARPMPGAADAPVSSENEVTQ